MKSVLAVIVMIAAFASGEAVRAATVLITGCNRGLGFHFAKQYAERGYTRYRHVPQP